MPRLQKGFSPMRLPSLGSLCRALAITLTIALFSAHTPNALSISPAAAQSKQQLDAMILSDRDPLVFQALDEWGNPVSRVEDAPENKKPEEKEKRPEEKKDEPNIHPNMEEKVTPTATATSVPQLSKEQQLDEKLKKIRNPQSNEEALERVATDPKRKALEAIAEAKKEGKELDLFSNKYFSQEMWSQYDQLEQTVRQGILSGKLDEQQGLQMLAQARLGAHNYTAGGAMLDGTVADGWNPGKPFDTKGKITPGYQIADAQSRAARTLQNMNQVLTDQGKQDWLQGVSKFDIARQYSLYFMDHTTTAQGNWGSCWTCSAEAMGWAWRPDEMTSAMNQLALTGSFRSPFDRTSQSYNSKQLTPSSSNRAFDMNKAGSGEQSYVNMLGQRLIGNISGNSAPWNGGVPEYAARALYPVTGINGVPTQYGVGGREGLVNAINNGTVRLVQYIPFPGHSASNSGRVLATTDGGFLGFGVNDNSWGQSGEHMFRATRANVDKFRFPGGGGSRFSGPGGMSALNSLMNRMQGNGNGGSQGTAASAQAAQQIAAQEVAEYNKLDTNGRITVRSVCVSAVTPGTKSLPQVCRVALTDKTLPGL